MNGSERKEMLEKENKEWWCTSQTIHADLVGFAVLLYWDHNIVSAYKGKVVLRNRWGDSVGVWVWSQQAHIKNRLAPLLRVAREKVNKDPTPRPFPSYFVCILLYPLDHFYEVSVAWLLLLGHAFNGGWILEKIKDTVKLDEVLQ